MCLGLANCKMHVLKGGKQKCVDLAVATRDMAGMLAREKIS